MIASLPYRDSDGYTIAIVECADCKVRGLLKMLVQEDLELFQFINDLSHKTGGPDERITAKEDQ